jgi:mono/diheme cytochrome c family protein
MELGSRASVSRVPSTFRIGWSVKFSMRAVLVGMAICGGSAVQASAAEREATFAPLLRPMLAEHCVDCHNAKTKNGGVDLTPLEDDAAVLKQFKLARRLVEQVRTGQMPPDDDTFTAERRKALVDGVERTLSLFDRGHPSLVDPGPAQIRRLSHVEYKNVIRDLTGYELDVVRIGLPSDSTGSNYENVAAALQMPPTLLEKYFLAADTVLNRFFGEVPEAQKKPPVWQSDAEKAKQKRQQDEFFKTIPPEADRATARVFVARFTRQAWRRPIAEGEIDRLTAVYDAALQRGETPRLALRRTLKPVLVAPDFLFRIEADRTPDAPTAGSEIPAARVSDVELASRLSFFLWSSAPDETLLNAARRNELSDPKVLEAQVRRMLADSRAQALTDNFFVRWLGANRVLEARPSTEFYPTFNDGLKRAMLAEVTTFCEHLRTADRPVLDLLAADYTFVNAELAGHYGLAAPPGQAGVDGKEVRRVALRPEDHRGGVLGMGAVLASTSHTDRTSPTQRGKWILETVFGTPPPPPPANASQFRDDGKKKEPPKNFREKLAQHAVDATCAGCHRRMDPLGFGLDNFNAVGAWRETTAELDTSGVLPGGEKFAGVDDLKKIIWARRGEFSRNLVGQMLTYALGRELEYFDELQIARIQADLDRGGGRFSTLILGVVNSYPFQYRRSVSPHSDPTGTSP